MATESRDQKRILEIISFSKRPYFTNSYSSEKFDSIEILIDGTILSTLTDEEDNDLITEMNISGLELPIGTVITWDKPMASIASSEIVKINRTFGK